ncbi:Phosphoribosylglycinamide formyltransferase [Rhynchospora pubera]|uniref:Phosphoribosylglycinamide formyltransferase, chloroplastic n=1 Tax=Rhynchospora pubera TaxID=906938 RepID=A0AAV8G363_9POAL|nr:Phosphoribosylglycinamide formyltransferase [Rhynchospora pubera]
MEAATLRFGSICSPNQTKESQFSQKRLKSRLSCPPNYLIQKNNLNSNQISTVKPSRLDWRVGKSKCSSLEPKNTSGDANFGKDPRRKKLAIFVSGGGSNFRSIHEASIQGLVNGNVAVLVTDKPGCGGAVYARNSGIPIIVFPKSKLIPDGLLTEELLTVLRNFEIDFVLLAGFLKLIPVELVQAYPKSILNIHPSLLPAFGGKGFYGLKVHKAVIASGARYSGPTVHFVDEHYDTGRTLAQRVVPVLANDTPEDLAARVLHEEHQVYVETVAALCEDRIVWREDGVPLIRSRTNPDELS